MARNTPAKIIYPLPHRSSRTRPPSEIVELNRNSPQANGLKFWAPLNTPEYKEIISGLSPTFGSTGKPSFIIDPVWGGYAYHYTDNSDSNHRLIYDNMSVWTNNIYHASLSVWVRSSITTWSSTFYFMLLGMSGWSGDRAIRLRLEQAVPRFVLDVSNDGEDPGAASIEYDFSTLTQYVWYHLVGTWNSGADRMRLYIDGVKVNEEGSVETGPMYATTADFTLLGHNDEGSNAAARLQGIRDARYYDRELSEAEVWDMYSNPWSIYKPTQPRFYSIPPKQEEGSSVVPVSNLMGWQPRKQAINTAFELNRDSPLADGLVWWLPVSVNNGKRNRISGSIVTEANSPILRISDKGLVYYLNGTEASGSPYLEDLSFTYPDYPYTLNAWIKMSEPTWTNNIIRFGDTGSTHNDTVQVGTTDRARATSYDGGGATAQSTTQITDWGIWHMITGVFAANDARAAYLDGGGKGTDAASCNPTVDEFRIGSNHLSSFGFNGEIFNVGVWNRALSDAEVLELYKNPWTLYKPYTPQFWSFPPEPKENKIAIPFVNTWKYGHAPNTAFELNRDSPLANGLVFWLPLSDQSLIEKTARQSPTAINGTPVFLVGEKGYYVDFNWGENERIFYSSTASITNYPFTISAWAQADNTTNNAAICIIGDGSGASYHGLVFDGDAVSPTIAAISSNAGANLANATKLFTTDVWYHAVSRHTSDTLREVFVDGGNYGSNTTSRALGNLNQIGIGATPVSSPGIHLDGSLFNVCIWNRILSDAEVLELYKNPWTLYKPIRPQFWSLPIAGVGHPTALRYIYTPGSRQWTPAQLGR